VQLHLSQKSRKKDSLNQFIESTEESKHILKFCSQTKAHLLIGSSLELYKDQPQNSLLQSFEFLENLAKQYCKHKKVNARIARLPYYYGKYFLKEKTHHNLSQFIKTYQKENL